MQVVFVSPNEAVFSTGIPLLISEMLSTSRHSKGRGTILDQSREMVRFRSGGKFLKTQMRHPSSQRIWATYIDSTL